MNQLNIPDHARTLGEDLEIAVEAAFEAGQIIRSGYGKLHEVEEKGVGDLVSRIDKECDAKVQEKLALRRPNDSILSEELSPDQEENGNRLWIVDPLDATSGFLFQAGTEITSVMVALRDQLETQLGVILFPLTGNWFYAKNGVGCFKNGQRIKIPSTATTKLSEAWIDMNHFGDSSLQSTAFSHLDKKLRSPKGARFVTRGVPHSGIVCKLIEQKQKIAAVIHDNNPQKVKQAPWDIIPAQIILEEAGGIMMNLEGQRTNSFKPELIIAATNRQIATAIAKLAA